MGTSGYRRVRMATSAAVALIALGAVVAPVAQAKSVTIEPVGSISIGWQGEAARGCAAEGLCGVAGSMVIEVGGSSAGSSGGSPPIELTDQSVTSHVVELASSGVPEASCAAVTSVDFDLTIRRTAAGPRAVVGNGTEQLPSAGRCAGPTAGDFGALTLPVHSMGSRGDNLSGFDRFGAGPFTVTVDSHIRALFNPSSPGYFGPGSSSISSSFNTAPKAHSALMEEETLVYRVVSVTGSLGAAFAGVSAPLCQTVGTCGAQGTIGLIPQLAATNSSPEGIAELGLTFSGSRIVKRRVTAAGALRDLQAGRLASAGDSFGQSFAGTLTGTLTQPGVDPCEDRVHVSGVALESASFRAGEIPFSFGGGAGFLPDPEPLRSRCPGPTTADVVGDDALATGSLPLRQLGGTRLTLTMSSAGAFSGDGYEGSRNGTVTLELARVREAGGTTKTKIFSGSFR